MILALIDYGAGNLKSAGKALERAALQAGLACEIRVTHAPDIVARADRIVLPGVGAFADCMAGVNKVPGLRAALEEAVIRRARPFLGICVGMQLLAERGLEFGICEGLGWIPGEVRRLEGRGALKIPHMGWNELIIQSGRHPILDSLNGLSPFAYFVHSYVFHPSREEHLLASADYGGALAAVVGRDNMIGTQFHPEKSQALGLAFLSAFLKWAP